MAQLSTVKVEMPMDAFEDKGAAGVGKDAVATWLDSLEVVSKPNEFSGYIEIGLKEDGTPKASMGVSKSIRMAAKRLGITLDTHGPTNTPGRVTKDGTRFYVRVIGKPTKVSAPVAQAPAPAPAESAPVEPQAPEAAEATIPATHTSDLAQNAPTQAA